MPMRLRAFSLDKLAALSLTSSFYSERIEPGNNFPKFGKESTVARHAVVGLRDNGASLTRSGQTTFFFIGSAELVDGIERAFTAGHGGFRKVIEGTKSRESYADSVVLSRKRGEARSDTSFSHGRTAARGLAASGPGSPRLCCFFGSRKLGRMSTGILD